MRPAGRLVTIKRSGADGAHFPLSLSTCLFGRGTECDIRIQLPVVSKQHCKIEIKEQEAILCNFSSTNPTQVNGSAIQEPVPLKHGDIITIIDRSFRYENESHQNGRKSTENPGKTPEQEPARRTSRAGFSADPDGKEQDSKAHSKLTERNTWGRPLEPAKKFTGDSSALDGADPEPPSAWSSEHQGLDGRNAGDPSSGDFMAKPRVTVGSGYGTPRSVPSPQCFGNRKRSESPFQKLYQSMKEELDAKPPGQNVPCCRKSGSHSGCTAGRQSAGSLQREPQLSCTSRRKSGRSSLVKEDPSSEPETNQTEKGCDVEPSEASEKLAGSSVPLSKMTKEKTPVMCPHQPSSAQEHKDENLCATLCESACIQAADEPVIPGKLLPRNQAPTKAEGAANPRKRPENLSSRSRRSAPIHMEALPTVIQSQPFLTQCSAHVERKIQKDSFNKPEKLGTAAGLPGLSSVDISNFGDSINRSEDLPLKRRRVSFGSHLRPELFDENLPPNTPVKRGETPAKRKSLASHSPAVLKKIIKEKPASPGTESSAAVFWKAETQSESTGSLAAGPGITAPGPGDQRRRSGKASAASGGSVSPQDTPKRGGRKSVHLSSKRTSISRSQHGILQMICSKRRSGASEANLIVAKSWADVVKLGAKQTQTKVVKHGPHRQTTRRQRRPNTPKKPMGSVHNQFSTGHANSPCTIIIGKAQIEKVNVPARPYRMLNNLVFNQKMDYNEDLSGLTEMFKTPVKETTTSPGTLSNSENLLGKKSQVTNSGGKPLPNTLEILGSNVFSSTQKTGKQPSDKLFESPSLRRQSIRGNENAVKTPRNIRKMTHFEMRTPDFSPEPLKMVSSANRLRRSVDLRNAQLPSVESKSEAEADAAGTFPGRRMKELPREGPGEGREASDTPGESTESEGKCGKMTNTRRSRTGGQKSEPLAILMDTEKTLEIEPRRDLSGSQLLRQTPDCTKQTRTQEEEATNMPCGSPRPEPVNPTASGKRQQRRPSGKVDVQEEASALRKLAHLRREATHTHAAPGGDDKSIGVFKGTAEQNKDSVVYGTGMKKGPRTPKKKTQALEDLSGFKELFQTPKHIEEFKTVDKTIVLDRSPQPGPVGTPTSAKTQANILQRTVDVRQECPALEKLDKTSRETTHTRRVPGGDGRAVKASEESTQQRPEADVTRSRRQVGPPKEKAQPLEDLAGFQELFQTPGRGKDPKTAGETTVRPCKSAEPKSEDTLRPSKRWPRTSLQKVKVKEELSALRKLSQSPGTTMHTPMGPAQEEKGIRAFMGTPDQKENPAENLAGLKRQPRTPKEKAQPLEDLAGFQELFQTPGPGKDPKTAGETIDTPCKSAGPEPVRTPASTKRRSKTSVAKVEVKEEASALRELTQVSGKATHTPRAPAGGAEAIRAFEEPVQQTLHPAAKITGNKQQAGPPKEKAQPLEDLTGFQELFQTPGRGKDPKTAGETTVTPCKSAGPGPVRAPASTKRRSKTSVGKVEVKEEFSALRNLSQLPGRAMHTPPGPAQKEKSIRVSKGTPEQKADPAENLAGLKRQPRTPKEKAQSLEDLAGFQELFQTPGRGKDPKMVGETTDAPCKSAGPEPVRAPASTKRRSKTSVGKVEMKEEFSALRKLSQSPGRAMHTPVAPVQDRHIEAIMESPRQKLDMTENLTGLKRQSRAPKEKAQPLEDLAGFQELFQTPGRGKDPKTAGETTDTPCKSAAPEPVRAPASTKRRSKTSVGKVEVKEEFSALRKLSQSPGTTMHTPPGPLREEKAIRALMGTPEQKADPAENLAGLKRQPRTRKEKAQSLEDLAGFQELFQTPGHGKDPKMVGETTDTPCKSAGPEPVRTPASTKRRSKTSVAKVEVKEEASALRELTQVSWKATHTPRAPAGGAEAIRAFEEPVQQTLHPAAKITGNKQQAGPPKEKAQPLEDLTGFQELFQTPGRGNDPKTAGEITDTPCKSAGPEPVRTPASTKRRSKTVGKVEVKEEYSALRKLSQSPGRAMHTSPGPAQKEKSIRVSKGTPEQKENPEDFTGLKRQPRIPKEKAQPLEDLTGFQELFQTPGRGKDPKTAGETTDTPCKSAGLESVRAPASTKRRSKTSVGKVEVKEEFSALRKLSQSPGRAMHTSPGPAQKEKSIRVSKGTPEQKENPEDFTGLKRQPRIPKEKAQPLEDLTGFQELFQIPGRGKDPKMVGETIDTPCKSAGPEPVRTPASTKRRSKTSMGKVEVKEEASALRELTQVSGKATHTPRAPAGGAEAIRAFEEPVQQTLHPAAKITGNKRQAGPPKEKAQPLEDLTGFQELFQTPGRGKDPKTAGETTVTPCKSAGLELEGTLTPSKKQLRTSLPEVDKEELSPVIKLKRTLRKTSHTQEESTGGNKGVKTFRKPAKRKLDTAEKVTGSKRRRGAPTDKAQPLEDLAGLREPILSPGPTEGPASEEKTTDVPCSSPQPEPVDRPASAKRRPRTRLRTAEAKEESPAVRKPTRTARATTRTRRAPGGEDQDSRAFEESAQQAQAPAARAAGSRRLRGAPEGKAQPLQDLAGSQEPVQGPGPTEGPTSEGKTTKIPCKSPQPEPVETAAPSKRQLRTRLRKAPVTQELSEQGKVIGTSGGPMHTCQEPEGDSKNIKVVKEPVKRKLNPTADAAGSKRRRGAPEDKVQSLEDLAGLREPIPSPGPTEGPASEEKTTDVPCSSPQPAPVHRPASAKRRLRTRLRTAEVKEESPVRKPTRTARATTHTRRAPGGEDQDSRAFEESAQQALAPAARAAGSRRLRGAPEGKAQPLQDLAGSQEPVQGPGPTEGPSNDADSLKSTPRQTAERPEPLTTFRRVLRAPKAKPAEDEVGSRHPAASRSRSNVPLPKGKSGKDELPSGLRGLCSETVRQDAAQVKAVHGKRKAVPRDSGKSPEPLVMNKGLKILMNRIELVAEHTTSMETEAEDLKAEDPAPADKGIFLRTRHQNKTEGQQQRTEFTKSENVENVKIKRQERQPMRSAQGRELRNPDDGDEKPASRGKGRERRTCLRAGGQNQTSQPHTAEEGVREKSPEVPTRNQQDKGATTDADFRCLRSRKPGTQPRLEGASEQRVTRGAKRCAESLKKDKETVCTKKTRSRSRRDNEDI